MNNHILINHKSSKSGNKVAEDIDRKIDQIRLEFRKELLEIDRSHKMMLDKVEFLANKVELAISVTRGTAEENSRKISICNESIWDVARNVKTIETKVDNLVNEVSKKTGEAFLDTPLIKPKDSSTLIVGTSEIEKLNKSVLQNVTNSDILVVKAFKIDDEERPAICHKTITQQELLKKPYDTLVLQGGVNEITEIDIIDKDFIKNIDVWKQKVAKDSVCLFNLAEESLVKNPRLKRVIILKRMFRCDNEIKQSLSQFANSIYDDIWAERGRPSSIIISDQNLACDGELRVQRFGHHFNEDFDGIHLRGSQSVQHYTRSLIDVFIRITPTLAKRTVPSSTQVQSGNY